MLLPRGGLCLRPPEEPCFLGWEVAVPPVCFHAAAPAVSVTEPGHPLARPFPGDLGWKDSEPGNLSTQTLPEEDEGPREVFLC